MINFNLVKNIISLCFHEHKNSKLTYFSSISKEANFRVLQKACCAWADNDCKSLSGGKTKIQKIGRKQNTDSDGAYHCRLKPPPGSDVLARSWY
jgi:hypothetical protein